MKFVEFTKPGGKKVAVPKDEVRYFEESSQVYVEGSGSFDPELNKPTYVDTVKIHFGHDRTVQVTQSMLTVMNALNTKPTMGVPTTPNWGGINK